MSASYREIASELRRSILEGRYRAGDVLPKLDDLAQRYGAAYQTVRSAIGLLEQEGLVESIRRRGTVVRDRPTRRRITRSRQVYRDDRGYYFDPEAQPWVAVSSPTVSWGPAPADIALVLGVNVGDEVLVRDRVIGPPGSSHGQQLATSYLPAWLARGTVLAEQQTGPGGIYDRLEEMRHGPLRWAEALSARMPSPDEAKSLDLPPGVPLLRIVRTTTSASGQVLEVNDTRMSAELFEIGYPIRRSPGARVGASADQDGDAEDR
ncbi:GntR family transcriptional regulator [Streptosporangium saharense]|uniref:GntR family transcriptional regulator n=1 Tax=Streptosporangium saharense TaxID=1706840 RepID=A0A7W7QXI9_9ACTN|nr:GntR family transcriptional regulator [Streptosporangium saharense]